MCAFVVDCSSSLKRKSREQRSSNSHVNKRSSVSANENPEKDSSSSDGSTDDQDNLPEKPYDISCKYMDTCCGYMNFISLKCSFARLSRKLN